MSSNTFSYDETRKAFIRDHDKEVMAFLKENGSLEWTHNTREENYGSEIIALQQSLGLAEKRKEIVSTPAKQPATAYPPQSPPRHPQLGFYHYTHLLHDHAHMEDKSFNAKWGGRMAISTTRTCKTSAHIDKTTGDAIRKRISQ